MMQLRLPTAGLGRCRTEPRWSYSLSDIYKRRILPIETPHHADAET
jgi:hypothetical protein